MIIVIISIIITIILRIFRITKELYHFIQKFCYEAINNTVLIH